MKSFQKTVQASGILEKRRQSQVRDWIYAMIKDQLEQKFFNHPEVRKVLPETEQAVITGKQPVTQAVKYLFDQYEK